MILSLHKVDFKRGSPSTREPNRLNGHSSRTKDEFRATNIQWIQTVKEKKNLGNLKFWPKKGLEFQLQIQWLRWWARHLDEPTVSVVSLWCGGSARSSQSSNLGFTSALLIWLFLQLPPKVVLKHLGGRDNQHNNHLVSGGGMLRWWPSFISSEPLPKKLKVCHRMDGWIPQIGLTTKDSHPLVSTTR